MAPKIRESKNKRIVSRFSSNTKIRESIWQMHTILVLRVALPAKYRRSTVRSTVRSEATYRKVLSHGRFVVSRGEPSVISARISDSSAWAFGVRPANAQLVLSNSSALGSNERRAAATGNWPLEVGMRAQSVYSPRSGRSEKELSLKDRSKGGPK
jgi:hypothetical protein